MLRDLQLHDDEHRRRDDVFTPWICWLVFGIWGIVRLARRKLAVLVVVAGGVLAVVLYALGIFLLTATIG